MTSSPTIYKLIFKKNIIGEYDVYEQHRCQEPGCFWTDEQYTGNTCIPGHIEDFVSEYENNLIEGIVAEIEVVR